MRGILKARPKRFQIENRQATPERLDIAGGLLLAPCVPGTVEEPTAARLQLPLWILGTVAWAAADVRRVAIVPLVGALAVWVSPVRRDAIRQDAQHSVRAENPASKAARWIAGHKQSGIRSIWVARIFLATRYHMAAKCSSIGGEFLRDFSVTIRG